jgi:hypothetical protein
MMMMKKSGVKRLIRRGVNMIGGLEDEGVWGNQGEDRYDPSRVNEYVEDPKY